VTPGAQVDSTPFWETADPTRDAAWDETYVLELPTGKVWTLRTNATPDPNTSTPVFAIGWFPDGDLLIAVDVQGDGAEVFRGRPNGGSTWLRALPFRPREAEWSPDGEMVAITGYAAQTSIRALVIDGGTWETVAEFHEASVVDTEWSYRGDYLSVTHRFPPANTRIWRASTRTIAGEVEANHVAWQPASNQLAYLPPSFAEPAVNPIPLRLRDPESGGDVLLATVDERYAFDLAWSPDGARIAVTTSSTTRDIHVVNALGDAPTMVVTSAIESGWLDSKTLLINGNWCQTFDVMTVDVVTQQLNHFTSGDTVELNLRTSPARDSVAFRANGKLYLVDVRNGSQTALPTQGNATVRGIPGDPWSPNGRYLLFSGEGGHGLCEGTTGGTTTVAIPG
jgi:Tol biopolymer transport system component